METNLFNIFICPLIATDHSVLFYPFGEGACLVCTILLYVGRDSSVGIATYTKWTVPESHPGGDEIFRTRPDRPWGPPSLLYSGYRVCFRRLKRPRRRVDHPSKSNAVVKEKLENYFFSAPGASWPVLG